MSLAPKRVVVVGAGLAGLATAIRLAAEGVQVTVVERGTRPGGKMGRREIGPYRWDSGPTIFTLPELFDQLWSAAGAKRSDDLTLLKVEPASRTFFADGSVLETSSDLTKLAASFGALDPRDAAGIPAFMRRGEKLWRELDQTFFRQSLSPLSLLSPMSWLAGIRLDAATPYSRRINSTFHDERIRHVMRYKSIYLGSTPQSVPGAFLSIPYIEAKFGTWHPQGGMHEAPLAMERLARRLGVEFRYGTDAIGSVISNKRISALRIAPRSAQPRTLGTGPAAPNQPGEERIEADAVLLNADIAHANRDLIGEEHLGLFSRRRLLYLLRIHPLERSFRHSIMDFLGLFRPLFGQFPEFRSRYKVFPLGGRIRNAAHAIFKGIDGVHRILHACLIRCVIHRPTEITGHALGFPNKLANFAKYAGQFFGTDDNQPHDSRDQYLSPSQSKHRDPSLYKRGDSD